MYLTHSSFTNFKVESYIFKSFRTELGKKSIFNKKIYAVEDINGKEIICNFMSRNFKKLNKNKTVMQKMSKYFPKS